MGAFPANGFDLFDMAGNVWEWTADWFAEYGEDEQAEPCWPSDVDLRVVVRGGCWHSDATGLRRASTAFRFRPVERDSDVGFRCVREVFP